jgi:hypothetical protein
VPPRFFAPFSSILLSPHAKVLVGKTDRDTSAAVTCDAADIHIESMHELRQAMPELYR